MPLIIDASINISSSEGRINGQLVKFRPCALLVEISIVPPGGALSRTTSKVTAVIDTGNTSSLAIRERHLNQWSGGLLTHLPIGRSVGVLDVNGNRFTTSLYGGDIWLHSNISGVDPIFIPGSGFVIYPAAGPQAGPPFPLLGQDALRSAALKLEIDYDNLSLKISKP